MSKQTYLITTFSQINYLEYGEKSITSWKNNWPKGWKLVTVDTDIDIGQDIKFECSDKKIWIDYVNNSNVLEKFAKKLPRGHQRSWEKFCHKSWAQITAFEKLQTGYVIWMDLDVQFLKTPPIDLVEKEINGFFSGYLGRDQHSDKRHSAPETGIIFYDLDHLHSKNHFKNLRKIYTNLNLFEYSGWSDEVIYGFLKDNNPIYYKTMSPTNVRYPLAYCYLSEYFEHWMGHHAKKRFSYYKDKND
jgi:hypothetical protein